MNKILITGSGGLVGSESVRYFSRLASSIIGLDDNSRGRWFGQQGSVAKSIYDLKKIKNFEHIYCDVRNADKVANIVDYFKPTTIIHCAGQPSHEKSAEIPYEDFQVNTLGTVNLLEAYRKFAPHASFIFTSTNKVYGDRPNYLEIKEEETRYSLAGDSINGINESMSIDTCLHSPFGANKAAADLIVQEYGRYYNLNTVCFRCGCITGSKHKGVEQHGFLNYLCKAKEYTIFGYKGKQVRDNIHASDLILAFHEYLLSPRVAAVYNIGGGKENSCSILEALKIIKDMTGREIQIKFDEARKGDHKCYLTDYSLFTNHYPKWSQKYTLKMIFEDLLDV